jgi:hypothetical protein
MIRFPVSKRPAFLRHAKVDRKADMLRDQFKVAGGKITVLADEWFTWIDAKGTLAASQAVLAAKMKLGIPGGGRIDITQTRARYRTLIPNAAAAALLAAVGIS